MATYFSEDIWDVRGFNSLLNDLKSYLNDAGIKYDTERWHASDIGYWNVIVITGNEHYTFEDDDEYLYISCFNKNAEGYDSLPCFYGWNQTRKDPDYEFNSVYYNTNEHDIKDFLIKKGENLDDFAPLDQAFLIEVDFDGLIEEIKENIKQRINEFIIENKEEDIKNEIDNMFDDDDLNDKSKKTLAIIAAKTLIEKYDLTETDLFGED